MVSSEDWNNEPVLFRSGFNWGKCGKFPKNNPIHTEVNKTAERYGNKINHYKIVKKPMHFHLSFYVLM